MLNKEKQSESKSLSDVVKLRAEDDSIIIVLDERLRWNFVERTTALLQLQFIVTAIDANTKNSTAKNSNMGASLVQWVGL